VTTIPETTRDAVHGPCRVRIQTADFSVAEEIAQLQVTSRRIGCIVTFLGTARDFSAGRAIDQIDFEHYPGMAEARLSEIRQQAMANFDIIDMTILHRTGRILPGENIVLIVVAASHRKAAFAACEWGIDLLKRTVPIWKQETTPDGTVWVETHA